ncbi:50S ribosomal protein L22, putative [Eimeria brunetti]|uniref:50S ribosomal protein L22, putative n=1 Tax=Eimeria brunetti TaxID=51314 RepID=U6LRV5_9EIME|nr:50S ribosomal protein L22, putative [Eimeria brunetti]
MGYPSACISSPSRQPQRHQDVSSSSLFAQLSFLAPPDPITVPGGEVPAAAGGGAAGAAAAFVAPRLPPQYVESNARYLRLSPIKTRRVIQEIRGKSLAAALAHLAASPRRPAFAVFRAIESALANAIQLHADKQIQPQLVSVTATNGPVFKRPFFKARGRMDIWRRPTTHVKVIIKAF